MASPQSNQLLKKALVSPGSSGKYTSIFHSEARDKYASNLTKS